ALPAGETLVDVPDPISIYGAAKLTGSIGSRLMLGLLSAVTGGEEVQGQPISGAAAARLAEPLSISNLARLRRSVGDNAHVGLMGTATTRLGPDFAYPATPGGELCPSGTAATLGSRCFHDAYVGGLDGRWRSPSGTYAIVGQAIGSLVEHGPSRQFLDGTV